jgi:hypothetical protein
MLFGSMARVLSSAVLIGFGAVLAFCLTLSEFSLVQRTSG